jgi:hypothetical protein
MGARRAGCIARRRNYCCVAVDYSRLSLSLFSVFFFEQDGFPRTLQQAEDLEGIRVRARATLPPPRSLRAMHSLRPPPLLPATPAPQSVSRVVNITLPEHVLMAKMLARRVCADCGRGYNVAAIKEGDLDMPPLLPKPSDCDKCHGAPKLITRADDTEDVVKARMVVYHAETAPLVAFYRARGKLQDFAVRKGLDDMPRLVNELGLA